jgi:acyl-CoA synthetase (AMP-forming)/AMP-acid ligase II
VPEYHFFTTIPEMLEDNGRLYRDSVAIADADGRLTYGQLLAEVDRAGRAVMACGVRPGDRVAVWSPNSVRWAIAALGAVSVGAVLVPVSTRFKGAEVAHVLTRGRPALLFLVPEFLNNDYLQILADATRLGAPACPVIALEGRPPAEGRDWDSFLARASEVPVAALQDRRHEISGNNVADTFFTSGTTGAPKPVLYEHEQEIRAAMLWMGGMGVGPGQRLLCVQPFFHIFGYKGCIIGTLALGGAVFTHRRFDPVAVLETIEAERITVFPAPPPVFLSVLAEPRRAEFDLSSLKHSFTGSTNVPAILLGRMHDELGFETVTTAYGMTEASTITMMTTDDDPADIAEWCGRPLDGVEVKIVDSGGAEVPRGEPGEVLARGWVVMRGYDQDADGTAEAIDSDGWLHTGDIGVIGAAGMLKITDRKRDMFIVGGFNVYPAEVERFLLNSGLVSQCAVVGIPDERLGEVGVAFVIPPAGQKVTAGAVIAWASENMSNYKVPRNVEIVDTLPINPTGKVEKPLLRERAASLYASAPR